MLEDTNNTLYLSLVSLWELQLKIMLGKFKFPKPLNEIIKGQQAVNDLQILPITSEHIYALENLPFHHKDPFDRGDDGRRLHARQQRSGVFRLFSQIDLAG